MVVFYVFGSVCARIKIEHLIPNTKYSYNTKKKISSDILKPEEQTGTIFFFIFFFNQIFENTWN